MTTKETIKEWFAEGVKGGYDFMLIVCDAFSYEDYPVYCLTIGFKETYDHYDEQNMQRIMEVYDLSLKIEVQIDDRRSMHGPEGWTQP